MEHRKVRAGQNLVYIPSYGGPGTPVKVVVLDTSVQMYSRPAVQVKITEGDWRFYGEKTVAIVEARQLAEPGSDAARRGDRERAHRRADEIAQELAAMGFKRDSPRGFRVRANRTNPTFTVSWEVLDQLMLERQHAEARRGSALGELVG